MVPCDGERRLHGFMKSVTISPNHPIHTKGVISPVSQKIGFPVVIYRHLPDGGYGAEHDCQIATYLMIDPVSSFAPFEYAQFLSITLVTVISSTTESTSADSCLAHSLIFIAGSPR